MPSLESRVSSFLRARSGVIDRDSQPELRDLERADFILCDGEIVCELKSICEDTTRKIPGVLRRHGLQPAEGRYILSEILSGVPNAEGIEREVWQSMTSDVETDIRKSNRQIRAEKSRGYASAAGLMVLVNDRVSDLYPDVLLHAIGQKLRKKRDGAARFPHVNIIWIISEVFPPEMGDVHFFLALALNPLAPALPSALQRVRVLNNEWQEENGRVRHRRS